MSQPRPAWSRDGRSATSSTTAAPLARRARAAALVSSAGRETHVTSHSRRGTPCTHPSLRPPAPKSTPTSEPAAGPVLAPWSASSPWSPPLLTLGLATAPAAHADGPGSGSPWVVSLGDSYISGEAGRLGRHRRTAPRPTPTRSARRRTSTTPAAPAETINRCHRSKAAEVYVGGGVNGLNLACSGAQDRDVHRRQRQLQAGPGLLQQRRQAGAGADAAGLRGHPQRQDGRGLDRRQQLQLRRHRPATAWRTSSTRRRGGRTTATTTRR